MIYDLYLALADGVSAIRAGGAWPAACIGAALVIALFAVRLIIAVRDRAG
jgi:hypothetical protein